MIKSRIRWVVHIARIGGKLNAYRLMVGKPRGMDGLEDISVDTATVLNWV